METPQKSLEDGDSRQSGLSHRHTPTPKMSERKRNLFKKQMTTLPQILDDDVDLGHMSPLQYSSSPTSYEEEELMEVPFDRNIRQTTFLNILSNKNNEITPEKGIMDNNSTTLPKKTEIPPQTKTKTSEQKINSHSPMTTIPEFEEESAKKRCLLQEKTPSERTINCRELRISFKKSLILGDLATPSQDEEPINNRNQKRAHSLSVLADKNSISPKEKMMKMDLDSKARTSLAFDKLSIPTTKFYKNENVEPKRPIKRYSAPVLGTHHKYDKKSSSGKLSSLCSHKIKKPVKVNKASLTKKVELAVVETKEVEKNIEIDEVQSSRINNILKNLKNPFENSRPIFFEKPPTEQPEPVQSDDNDRFFIPDEEDEQKNLPKKKFFKSRPSVQKEFKISNNSIAKVSNGKIVLPKSSEPVENDFLMLDEEFGDENHEVSNIINQLSNEEEIESFRKRIPYKATDSQTVSRQKSVLELLISNNICTEENFKMFIIEPEMNQERIRKILDDLVLDQNPNLFPIFNRNKMKKMISISNGIDKKFGRPKDRKVWKKIGEKQLQIDAGQKKFGATYCAECDLLYSVHEPEDETMHLHYHEALNTLTFKGWKSENIVRIVDRWGISGRIIAIQASESKPKLQRTNTILAVMNKEMGCPEIDISNKVTAYLAVANQLILGVCIAEPKSQANRIVRDNGNDYFSEALYPVKCGISRIWVATPYRNQGVASELISAVRTHFTFGHCLSMDELAFNSPTEAGKLLAAKITNRQDFLVYP